MRTTVTLDEDVAEALRDLAHERRQPFKRVLNDAIRDGLLLELPEPKPFKTKVTDMGQPHIDLTKATSIAFALEDEAMIEKMKQRDEATRLKRST
jgi:hypothetical protein